MKESWHNYKDKVKRFCKFSQEEWKTIAIVTLVFAFILSFDQWGETSFDLVEGLKNLFIALLIVGPSVYVHEMGHRLHGILIGFRAETRIWWHGLWIALILCVLTGGKFTMYAATSMWAHHLTYHRFGFFRYGPNMLSVGLIALSGPLLGLFFGTFFKTLALILPLPLFLDSFIQELFVFNILLAAWNLLPIPPLDGSKTFFQSRLTYSFVAGSIISYALLIVLFGYYSYIAALLLGGIIWLIFYITVERVQIEAR